MRLKRHWPINLQADRYGTSLLGLNVGAVSSPTVASMLKFTSFFLDTDGSP